MAALLYLHGFLSSPGSLKAQQMALWLERERPDIEYHCPHLPPYPEQAARQIQAIVEQLIEQYGGSVFVMGSSLGGFWATWLAERYGLRAVLINPSVRPWQFMPDFIEVDLKSYHTDDSYRLSARHLDEIQAYETAPLTRPENLWLLVQTGDETLDYRQAVAKYQGARQTVEPGGDHSFQGFERYIPEALVFLEKG